MNAQIGANAPPSRLPWPPILMAMTLAAGLALDAATGASLIDRASSPSHPGRRRSDRLPRAGQ